MTDFPPGTRVRYHGRDSHATEAFIGRTGTVIGPSIYGTNRVNVAWDNPQPISWGSPRASSDGIYKRNLEPLSGHSPTHRGWR